MSDHLRKTYEMFEQRLSDQLAEVKKTKEMLNALASELKIEPPYPDVAEDHGGKRALAIKPDTFFNKPFATAVAAYLEMRGGAVPFPEIVAALREGGLDVKKSSESEMRLSILKNTATFVLIGDNNFGLKKWYGKLKRDKEKEREGGPDQPKKRGRPKKDEPSTSIHTEGEEKES